LRAAGVNDYQIRRLVGQGDLVQMMRGVYALAEVVADTAGMPDRRHALAVSAHLKLNPLLVASHQSAARIHRLDLLSGPGLPDLAGITLTRKPSDRSFSARSQAQVHRAAIPSGHVMTRFGVRVTTPARTVADLARTCSFAAAVVTADSAIRKTRTSKTQIRNVLERCTGWPGAACASRVVDFSSGLAESPLESVARVVIHEAGLPPPRLQVTLHGPLEAFWEYRVDFLWREQRTILEVDGNLKYDDPTAARRQLKRDRLLREADYEVVHATWEELIFQPQRVIDRIRAAFARARILASTALRES
jgi:hypothetical protein